MIAAVKDTRFATLALRLEVAVIATVSVTSSALAAVRLAEALMAAARVTDSLLVPARLEEALRAAEFVISSELIAARDDEHEMAAVMAKEGFYQRQPKMFAAGANMALAAYEIGRTTAIDVADVVNRLRGLKIAQVEDHVIHLSDLHEEHSTPGNVLTLPQLKKGGHDDADAS